MYPWEEYQTQEEPWKAYQTQETEPWKEFQEFQKTLRPDLEQQFEGQGIEANPWVDPTGVLAGGITQGAMTKGVGLLGKLATGTLGTLTGTIAEPVVGQVGEAVAEKYPWASLPLSVGLGVAGAKLIENPIQKLVGKGITPLLKTPVKPIEAPVEPPTAPKVPEAIPEVGVTPERLNIPPIIQELGEAGQKSLTQLRGQVSNVRYGQPGEILFEFKGKTYTTPEPRDVLPVGHGEASQSWALRQILDKKATISPETFKPIESTTTYPKEDFTPLPKTEAGMMAFGQEQPSKYMRGGQTGINAEKIGAEETTKKVLQDTTDIFNVQKKTTSWEETEKAADELAHAVGYDPRTLRDKYKGDVPFSTYVQTSRNLMNDQATRLDSMRQALVERGTPPTEQEMIAVRQAMNNLALTMDDVTKNVTGEAGRALNIHKKLSQGYDSVAGYKKLLKQIGGEEFNKETMDKFLKLDTSNPVEVATFVRGVTQSSIPSKLQFAWINALLTMPTTHEANMIGNTFTFLYKPLLETPIEVGMDVARSLIKGKPRERFLGEIPKEISGAAFSLWQGVKAGLRGGIKAGLKEMENQLPQDILLRGKIEQIEGNPLGTGALAKVIGSPTGALKIEDNIAKAAIFKSTLNADAYRVAMREVQSGTIKKTDMAKRIAELNQNPSDAMYNHATSEALYRTFNDPNWLASLVSRAKSRVPALNYIMPFVRTPANIAAFALERTPLALLSQKGRTQEGVAKMLSGSILGAGTMALAGEGFITGGGPKDTNKKAALYRTGWQPYSLKIGDKYYSYNRFEPVGSIMGMAADLKDVIDQYGTKNAKVGDLASQIMMSFTKNITSKTFLAGLNTVLDAISDPARYGEKWYKQAAGSVIPSVVGGAARSLDPTLRETDTVGDILKARIPGMSETLLPKRDIWGEGIQRPGTPLTRMFSPAQVSQELQDPIDAELVRLMNTTDFAISPVSKKMHGIELTPEEHDKYAKIAGERARPMIENFMRSSSYPEITDEMKRNMIRNIFDKAREYASNIVMRDVEPKRRAEVFKAKYGTMPSWGGE